jgi:Chromo (CHRromatin Organisation MOdifier) domain
MVAICSPTDLTDVCNPPPVRLEISGEYEFEVEQIILHRDVKRGRRYHREYFIKWLGYGPQHNSSERVSSMKCDELIVEYWKPTQAAQLATERIRRVPEGCFL